MTVSTFYPDDHPESTSTDGYVGRDPASETWSTIHDSAGDDRGATSTQASTAVNASGTTNQWTLISRLVHLFDTSSLGSGATISSATYGFVVTGTPVNSLNSARSLTAVVTNPASNTDLAVTDYNIDRWDMTKQTDTDIAIAGITSDDSTYTLFTLNSTGLGNISKTGITKFGCVIDLDAEDDDGEWKVNGQCAVSTWTADENEAADIRPKLVVTYTLAFTPKVMMF